MFLERSFLVEASQVVILIAVLIGVALALVLMQWGRSPWHWAGLSLLLTATLAAACGLFWFCSYVIPLPTLLFSVLTAAAAFHVERLASVRRTLREDIRALARMLPRPAWPGGAESWVAAALDLLRRQMGWTWVELRFFSPRKDLMFLQSGSRRERPAEPAGSIEFTDAEFTARIEYPGTNGIPDAELRDRLGQAIAHELFAHFRILEVKRGNPRWAELALRGHDEWQLNVLRQIGAQWLDQDSARRAVLECMGSGILLLDLTGKVRYANKTALRLMPLLGSSPAGIQFFDALRQEGVVSADEAAQSPAALSVPGASFQLEVHCDRWVRPDLLVQCSAIHGIDNTYLGSIVSAMDQTDQKRLDSARQEMVALVAHELRTPLASIHGFAQQLERYALDSERVRRVAGIILRESGRLDGMTRSYLDLARLEQQVECRGLEPVDLTAAVNEAVEGMAAAAENDEVELRVDCPVRGLMVRGNPDLLERAVSNLVGNAIKYGGRRKRVLVRVHAEGGHALVEVADEGPGIPAHSLPRLFEKFYRVKSASSEGVPGSGLGLAYVREVAQQHGGSVNVESACGAGSRFALRIPLRSRN